MHQQDTELLSTATAEAALLRAALALPATDATELLGLVTVEDFDAEHSRAIFTTLAALVTDRATGDDKDSPVDPNALLLAVQDAGHFRIGWPISRALIDVATGNPASLTDAKVIAAELRNGRLRRAMATLANQLEYASMADDFAAAVTALNGAEDLFDIAGRAPALVAV